MRCTDLWEAVAKEELNTLMPPVVKRVNTTEKERGTVRLSFVPADPRLLYVATSENVAPNFKMGAHPVTIYTYASVNPAAYGAALFVPSGGQLRKHTPRHDQQARNKQTELTLE